MINLTFDGDKKELAFCLFCNSKYLPCLGEFLINLDVIGINYDAIHVVHNSISDEQIASLTRKFNKLYFHLYKEENFFKEYDFEFSTQSKYFINRNSFLPYVKYKALELLEFYRRVIISDLDVLFLSDELSDLFNLRGFGWRGTYNITEVFEKFFSDENGSLKSYKDFDEFNKFNGDEEIPNSGFILLNDDIDYKRALSLGDAFISKFHRYFTVMVDELVFKYIQISLNCERTLFTHSIYNAFPHEVNTQTKFVHFVNDLKPWNTAFIQNTFPLWRECYYLYQNKIHGPKLDMFIDYNNINNSLMDNYYTLFWLNLLKGVTIPANLKFPREFNKFFLIFDYKTDVYFEILTDYWNRDKIWFGFWIKNEYIIDRIFDEHIKQLSNCNNFMFNVEYREEGLYVYSNKINLNNCEICFNYFVSSILNSGSWITCRN